MKRLNFTLVFALLTAGASYATSISYDTLGTVFNCTNVLGAVAGCGTGEVTLGTGTDGVVLHYVTTSSTVDASPFTFANLGYVLVGCVNGGTTCSPETMPGGLTLSINIDQTAPDVLTGVVPTATLSGTIQASSSGAFIQWGSTPSVTLMGFADQVTYAISSTTLALVPPSNNNCGVGCPISAPAGSTTIQAQISDLSVPEPAISLLVAGGLLGLGTIRRRRK